MKTITTDPTAPNEPGMRKPQTHIMRIEFPFNVQQINPTTVEFLLAPGKSLIDSEVLNSVTHGNVTDQEFDELMDKLNYMAAKEVIRHTIKIN